MRTRCCGRPIAGSGISRRTAEWRPDSEALTGRGGVPVTLKLENLQRTGSLRERGANNMPASLDVLPSGVVAASAGNHAQAVALAATQRGIVSTVVMPTGAPAAKQQASGGYGAAIELVDGSLAACQPRARELETERGLLVRCDTNRGWCR